jgi:hypothetical protein
MTDKIQCSSLGYNRGNKTVNTYKQLNAEVMEKTRATNARKKYHELLEDAVAEFKEIGGKNQPDVIKNATEFIDSLSQQTLASTELPTVSVEGCGWQVLFEWFRRENDGVSVVFSITVQRENSHFALTQCGESLGKYNPGIACLLNNFFMEEGLIDD